MPSFNNADPIAFLEELCRPPNYLSRVVDDGQGVVVCCADTKSELRFNRVNLRGPVVLGDDGVRVALSVEHSIAGEVLSQRRAVQEPAERLEAVGGPQEAVDGNATALVDGFSGRIEELHE